MVVRSSRRLGTASLYRRAPDINHHQRAARVRTRLKRIASYTKGTRERPRVSAFGKPRKRWTLYAGLIDDGCRAEKDPRPPHRKRERRVFWGSCNILIKRDAFQRGPFFPPRSRRVHFAISTSRERDKSRNSDSVWRVGKGARMFSDLCGKPTRRPAPATAKHELTTSGGNQMFSGAPHRFVVRAHTTEGGFFFLTPPISPLNWYKRGKKCPPHKTPYRN